MTKEHITGYQFQKGQSGNPSGSSQKKRREKAARLVAEQQLREMLGIDGFKKLNKKELTQNDMDFWDSKLISMGTPELQALAKMDECPIYAKNQAFSLLLDMKNGRTTTLDKIRERICGKPVQRVELTGKDGESLINSKVMTAQEAKELYNKMNSEI